MSFTPKLSVQNLIKFFEYYLHIKTFIFLKGRVWLIDFNPFGEVTDSLLFTWEELTSGKNLIASQTQEDTTLQVVLENDAHFLCIALPVF